MQTICITTLIICILVTIIEVVGTKVNPIFGLHNLPKDIFKKLPAVAVLFVVFVGIVYSAGARNFWQGFAYSFGMWAAVKLYVTMVLECGWYAHTPSVWIPGTKDMKESYQNYKVYLSSIGRSLLEGAMLGLLIGGTIHVLIV